MKSKSSSSSSSSDHSIVTEEDAFLGFVDYARSVLLSSLDDRSESADLDERSSDGGGPPWSWIVSRILKTCSAYSSGVTSAILLSELSQAWDEQNRTGALKQRPGCLTQLMKKKKQKRTKLVNTVTIDSIYEKNFLSATSILEAVVVDVFLLPGTSIYMLSLGDIWSSSTIDLYLHRRYYDLVDLESPENGILKKGREVFLTGGCIRTAVRGSGHLQLLPTEYMVILLDEWLPRLPLNLKFMVVDAASIEHQFEACGCSWRSMTWNQDEDAMLLGAQFCSDNFSSISFDAVKDGISFSFYARIESIGLTEVQECGNIQRKQITLVDSDSSKLRFLLWGDQLVLANFFSVGSMLAIDRPFIAMASDCNIETSEEFCIEYGSATQLYLVPLIHHEEQVFLASQTRHLGLKSLDGPSQHLIRASQVVLPCDSQGTIDFSNFPFRSFVMDIHDKMTGVSLYGIVTDIYRERSNKETIFVLRIEDTTGAITAKLQFVKSWLEVSWFEQNSGASFVNLSCVPALLNSSCLHKLSFLSDLSILSHVTYTCNVRLDHIEHHHVQPRFLHVSCGHLVNEKSDGLMECSFCQCTCVGEVIRTCHVKTTLADESAKIFAWSTGQTASELLQISAEEFCELPEEEQAMYLYTLENERFTVAIVNSNWKASEDGRSSTPENDTATWEICCKTDCKNGCSWFQRSPIPPATLNPSDPTRCTVKMTIPESRIWRRKLRGIIFVAPKSIQTRKKPNFPSPGLPKGYTPFNIHQDDQPFNETKPEKAVQPQPTSRITHDWVITINEKLDKVRKCELSNLWLDNCIFRVPRNLRESHPKAFSPQVVSIGPYHRGDPSLKDMEKHKWRLLRHVLDRTGLHLEFFLQAMIELEDQTRRCYSKLSLADDISSQEFVEMMMLDACFIVELLRVCIYGIIFCGYSWADPILTSRGFLPCIQRDMLLLENQLPFFVIEQVFALTSDPSDHKGISVGELALRFFDSILPGCYHPDEASGCDDPPLHFLHYVRQALIPCSWKKPTFGCLPVKHERQPQLPMHCVTMLRNSGVKFLKKKSDKFMDIEFNNGVLRIPPLIIHDSTKSILLNLMAFEQCYPHCSTHVTSYASFMDGLISCTRDVQQLRYRGIIVHGLGSEEEVASLFNKLCKEIAFDVNDSYLAGVSADVNEYFDTKWHRWRASLRRDYFSNPWAIVSLFVAVLLIGLTTAQTFYSIFAYYFPRS
ncbi:hypothetical protein Scep_008860 [Stephania cephalantha]|uniref:Uncharacterized protein n=1 Tax=Stephania cephalantha TaxID=152367 RepID=A0AAP0PDM3_9MAGN